MNVNVQEKGRRGRPIKGMAGTIIKHYIVRDVINVCAVGDARDLYKWSYRIRMAVPKYLGGMQSRRRRR